MPNIKCPSNPDLDNPEEILSFVNTSLEFVANFLPDRSFLSIDYDDDIYSLKGINKRNTLTVKRFLKAIEMKMIEMEDCDNSLVTAETVTTDKIQAIQFVSIDGLAIRFMSEELLNDEEVVLAAIKNKEQALKYASDELQSNRDFVLTAVKVNGRLLNHLDCCTSIDDNGLFEEDKEIIIAAVKQSRLVLSSYTHHYFIWSDRDIVLAAVRAYSFYLIWSQQTDLRDDLEILIAAASTLKEANKTFAIDYADHLDDIEYEEFQEIIRTLDKSRLISQVEEEATEQRCNAVYLASKYGLLWDHGMKELCETFSEEIQCVDEKTNLYPFMLAAASENPNLLDTIFNLMKRCPNLVKFYHNS